jgi:CRISPR/Cas system-associated exonuclease Cas4 (RecB family)
LGLRAWLDKSNDIQKVKVIPLPEFHSEEELSQEGIPELPLFFHDPVGIFPKKDGSAELMLAAELSVTRLNALIDCPRKFYYSNILKLTDEAVQPVEKIEEEEDEIANLITSSSERGTFIHAQISKGIGRNFVVPRESHQSENEAPIEWALNELKTKVNEYHLVSEKQIKFPFFNFMISGIPDLLLLPKDNQIAQVWDFKTGRITVEGLKHYWLQLSVYAYALYELKIIPSDRDIELVLCFVDQQKIIKEKVNFEDCSKDLYPIWRSQNEPWKVNLEHCSQCSYGSICPR